MRNMDLNELLHAHQVAVINAGASGNERHLGMISEYADRIGQLRTISHTASIAHDASAPPTIIYGSYAGESADEQDTADFPRRSDSSNCAESENPDRGRADR
jgi:hypothetical protein